MSTSEPFTPIHRTLVDAIESASRAAPERGITVHGERPTDSDRFMSYAELGERIESLAAGLHAIGVAAHEPVLLVLETGFDFLVAFFACQRLRAIPVPTYPPVGLRIDAGLHRLAQIAARASTRHCLTSDALAPIVRELSHLTNELQVRTVSEVLGASSCHVLVERPEPEDTAFIQFTSGSTGNPKGVMLSHANLTANVHAIGLALQIVPSDVFVNWCPLYHDMGLIGTVLSSVYWQLPIALLSPSAFIRHPMRWLRAIDKHRGTISAAPNFAFSLAAARANGKRSEGLDLSSWRIACNGAEPVNPQTAEAFIAAFEPHGFRRESMFPVYGLAECSLAVAFPAIGDRPRYDRVVRSALAGGAAEPGSDSGDAACFVSVGRAVPGHQIRVVDRPGGTRVGDRVVGEIQVQGPSVMRGYYNDPSATASAFDDGWLRTGDLGYWADGELFIVGRNKDVIILRGRKLHPEDIERGVDELEGVRSGNVLAFGVYDEVLAEEHVVVVAEYAPGFSANDAQLGQRIRDLVMRDHGVAAREVVLVPRGTVPKTTSGKRQRALCRAQYLAGSLRVESARAETS